MQANRRTFLKTSALAAAGLALPKRSDAVGAASQVQLVQIVYQGGNWRPRATALRRLAWEIHKRTAINAALEPLEIKPTTWSLSKSPVAYLSGDRSFSGWNDLAVGALARFFHLGGMLIVDTAHTPDGDAAGFESSIEKLLKAALPNVEPKPLPKQHVLYRSFYQIDRPVGRIEGPDYLTGYGGDDRLLAVLTHHDLGGAFARDNLGNWEHVVEPGGDRQREKAFRLGVNLVMYALCLDYKNEEPHRRFGRQIKEG
jgi:hypothetical protein